MPNTPDDSRVIRSRYLFSSFFPCPYPCPSAADLCRPAGPVLAVQPAAAVGAEAPHSAADPAAAAVLAPARLAAGPHAASDVAPHSPFPVAAAALAQQVDAKRSRTRCVVVLAAVLEPLEAAHWPALLRPEAAQGVRVASTDRLVASVHARLDLESWAALRVARWQRVPEVPTAQQSEAARFVAALRWAVARRAPSPGAVDPSLRVAG